MGWLSVVARDGQGGESVKRERDRGGVEEGIDRVLCIRISLGVGVGVGSPQRGGVVIVVGVGDLPATGSRSL